MSVKSQAQTFIHQLINQYVTYFDVYRNATVGSHPVDALAVYKRRDEKYLMSKTIKVWGVENQQCVFITEAQEPLTETFITQLQSDVKDNIEAYIPDSQEHMSTSVLTVIVTEHDVDPALVKGVMRYRKLKFFKYGLHGWAELYLSIINLKNESVYIHRKGRKLIEPVNILLEKED
ncbi:hypothetical protein [Caldalkalibacillus salinus]|uniref:hypothetical protein n=1 Tax=Caldalkalibacillus salinus TaxID=2803787 RepID=UPI001923C550|nr:hypothetical protein [Caldalkalibacillus salinus]